MLTLLEGVRILDLSVLAPGAILTQKLADLGADVILVERPPAGNFLREMPPLGIGDEEHTGRGLHHPEWSRNKRSIALDITDPADRPAFETLVGSADVVVEGARPGVMKRLGADHDALKEINNDIIYCSITAWGQTGPWRDLPAHATSFELAAGYGDLVEFDEDGVGSYKRPQSFPTLNHIGATHGTTAILAALLQRQRTGQGAYLDVSVWQAAVASWHSTTLTFIANTGEPQVASETYGALYTPYRTSDGASVFVALLRAKFWRRFCEVVGRLDLIDAVDPYADDPRGSIAYGRETPWLGSELIKIFATRTAADWVDLAAAEQLPITPILGIRDLLDNPHVTAREVMVTTDDPVLGEGVRVPALPIKVAGEEFEIYRAAPLLGEHTSEILAELSEATDCIANPTST